MWCEPGLYRWEKAVHLVYSKMTECRSRGVMSAWKQGHVVTRSIQIDNLLFRLQ